MKKRHLPTGHEAVPNSNPVAKFAPQFNKAQVFADKTQYRRKTKHPKQEVWANVFARVGLPKRTDSHRYEPSLANPPVYRAVWMLAWLLFCPLSGCASATPLSAEDIKWLNRITYGVDTATLNAYASLGRAQFLEKQLDKNADDHLPPRVAAILASQQIATEQPEVAVRTFQQEHQRLGKLPKDEQEQAKKEFNRGLVGKRQNEAEQRHLLRAIYSQAQLKEQLTWFWFNHFNVSKEKGPMVKMALADYEDKAIRPYVLGKFRDMLIATIRHPVMLIYLDNVQNAVGKINENYARELMELHTLGVDGGYSQQDVQELARILTGVGMNWSANSPKVPPKLEQYYQHDGGFEFNPRRHDFSDKTFLGSKITGNGFAEVEQVVDKLSRHPATAHFVCKKLATYFVADEPPKALVEQMTKTFLASDGDIAATLRVMFNSKDFLASLDSKAKDPLHYVVSALRFAYEDRPLSDMQPAIYWLNQMGEPLFGHPTPDGFGLTSKDWLSPEQLSRRFEIAKNLGSGKARLTGADVDPKTLKPPVLANTLYYEAVEPGLSAQTRTALSKAASQPEWNSFLLSSPEFLYH